MAPGWPVSETLFTGQPGPKGDKGDRGEGMTRGARHAVIFLFAFSVLLAVLNFSWTINQVNSVARADQKASAADAAQVALCRSGNEARAEQVDLWTFIIRISKPPRTAQQRQVLAEFEQHLREVFAPRSCALPRPH